MTRLRYRIVDAFTRDPFGGNPAAVILPDPGAPPLTDALRQQIAAEMNLSETAFPSLPGPRPGGTPPLDADGQGASRELRWFTPTTEVSLCGHATLAAAHALAETGAPLPFRFHSRSGPLEVHGEGDGALRLDFPADPPREGPAPPGLAASLGIPEAWMETGPTSWESPLAGAAGVPTPRRTLTWATGTRCALLELRGPGAGDVLDGLSPDMRALATLQLPPGVMGVSVTVAGEGEPDFRSRFFGPWVGVDEDPVTGMAHCLLGPWWAARLGKERLEAVQGGRRRGSLSVVVAGDRIHLIGHAVTVAEGTLRIAPRS